MKQNRPHTIRPALRSLCLGAICTGLGVIGHGGPADAQAQLVMKVGTTENSRSPLGRHLAALALDIGERTKGTTHVKVFTGGVLGDEAALLSRTIDGSIQMYAGQLQTLEKVVPEVAVLSAPFVFRSDKQLHRALDRRVRKALDALLQRRGLVFGGFGGTAWRALIAHEPIGSADDLRGGTMDTERPHADLLLAALGATGAGQLPGNTAKDSPAKPATIDATPLRAVANQASPLGKHVLTTDHTAEVAVTVYSKRWFDGLPEDHKELLLRPTKELTQEARRHRRAQNARVLDAWSAGGVEVREPSAEQRRGFTRSLRKVATQIANRAGLRSWKLLRAARRG